MLIHPPKEVPERGSTSPLVRRLRFATGERILHVNMEPLDRSLIIEEELWKPRENVRDPEWSGFRNLWTLTDQADGTHLRQSAGINPVGRIRSGRGKGRRPAIVIFMKPEGDRFTVPWLDEVDLDSGFIRYFGDNRPERKLPAEATEGNRALLRELDVYSSSERQNRLSAAPILFFRNLGSDEGAPFTQFLGFGLIKSAHRITQLYKGRTFTNYAYDCVLFEGDENDVGRQVLDVAWLDDRRDPALTDEEADARSPAAWKRWIEWGNEAVDARGVRRFVDRAHRLSQAEQLPSQNSHLATSLMTVYDRYEGNAKHGFQALAALATEQLLAQPSITYHRGWVTPVGPDGGVDFVQRIDLGSGLSQTRLVVLGQAKCKKPWSSGVSAEELSRVVARLRRGWIGSFVTTSYFTDPAQREMVVDEYPVVLVAGLQLARIVEAMRDEKGFSSTTALLDWVEEEYLRLLRVARPHPSDILREAAGRELPTFVEEKGKAN